MWRWRIVLPAPVPTSLDSLRLCGSVHLVMPCLSLPVLCLVSLQPLDKLQRTELTKEAQQYVQAGFKLVMQEKVDRSLMGGFVLEFEDRLVDMSVKKKLEEFNNLVRAGSAAGLVKGRAGGSGAAGW